ncbi:hypothetical protein Tco_0333185 [Tanacetum coccineum]
MIPSSPLLPSPTRRDIIPKRANERETDLATSHRHDSHDMHVHHQDAQEDMAVLQAHIASLEREAQYLRTRVVTIDERDLQPQRRDDVDRVTRLMGRIKDLEDAREPERRDGPPDASSS